MNLVLLSGGSGQRLWPLSNDIRSKQFIKIFHREDGELESMVQRVYRQIKAVDTDATVTIATSKSQVSAITMSAGCRHTVIAETELKLIEVQLGKEIDVNDKQKFELEY